MSQTASAGRLTTMRGAMVIARRDFSAILFSRTFLFFLLGPLFPVIVGVLAGSVGSKVEENIAATSLGIVMPAADADAMASAASDLGPRLGAAAPAMIVLKRLKPDETADPAAMLSARNGSVAAVVSGTLARPVLTGTEDQIEAWSGPVSLIAAQASEGHIGAFPSVALAPVRKTNAADRQGHMRTAQAGQMLLFLLTMLLAGMVLSNLVEEKGNKIIEVLAAAIPMESVFYGKLFAMLAVSFAGIAVWGTVFGSFALAGGRSLDELVSPAIGWPAFIALGTAYFAMAYLLLGSVFLTVGSMATTVREVQTLSMPVSMAQLVVFFFATFATAVPDSKMALAAQIIPFSSPFAMLGKAAQDNAILPHLLALGWQAVWVALFVHFGARLFRNRVLKSGPQKVKPLRQRFRFGRS